MPGKFLGPCSEHQHLVGGERQGCKFRHVAASRARHHLGVGKAACLHARAAQQNLSLADDHSLEHALDIVVAVGGLLACFCRNHGIGHQEHGDGGCGFVLDERERQAQAIVAPLGAVGWVIQDEQDLHWRSLRMLAHASTGGIWRTIGPLAAYSPITRRRSSNSFLSISPRAKRSLRMSSGVRCGGAVCCHGPPTQRTRSTTVAISAASTRIMNRGPSIMPYQPPPHHII